MLCASTCGQAYFRCDNGASDQKFCNNGEDDSNSGAHFSSHVNFHFIFCMVLVCQWIVNEKMLACKLCLIYFWKSSLASSCRSKRCLNSFLVHHNYEKEVLMRLVDQ